MRSKKDRNKLSSKIGFDGYRKERNRRKEKFGFIEGMSLLSK